ncbi:MAG: DUF3656 domain-containing protein [Salinivirgaceae bacterium]|nr:DUF3656 domain-containing protein [Salinivirgaceae bacterium]
MKKEIELLAPGGDIDSIKAAIAGGANAVYCGLNKFNARNRAENITFEDLNGILRLAHKNNCQVFLTLNILIVDSEIPDLIRLLNKLVNTSIDGVIIQDFGLFYLLNNHFKSLKIHASTQLTTHNKGQIRFLGKQNASRVNLSRELNINEIQYLTLIAHQNKVLTEVFVHGSYCLSFSGICYMSSVHGGNSGNRGRCSQPCRDEYIKTPVGKSFPLNLKDNSAFLNLEELADAGVDSLKIEGRIKKFHYVFSIVDSWRKQLERFYKQRKLSADKSELYKVFNRNFSNAFLTGEINKDMFIDNPRDHSAIHKLDSYEGSSEENLEKAKQEVYDERTEIINSVRSRIDKSSIAKAPLIITVSGRSNEPLTLAIKTPEQSFELQSETNLENKNTNNLDSESLFKRLKIINDTAYFIEKLEMENLEENLFLPYKEITSLSRKILFKLNSSKETIDPIEIPRLNKADKTSLKPSLSVLISSEKDVHLCTETTANIYFQLPNSIKNKYSEYVHFFQANTKLIPWFPSIIMGEDYNAAIELLTVVQPKIIVTNNTGIAYEANKRGIAWIAGPHLNIVNSYSLKCLKENFNCSGSFISNEINKNQIKSIKKPENFDLFYSIYHPIVLMTSRQCLFHQVIGCVKDSMDETCLSDCDRHSSITNMKNTSFLIEKAKGNFHCIYNDINYLNTDIIADIPDTFSSFLIDLRDVKTNTKMLVQKVKIIELFENLVNGKPDSPTDLHDALHPSTNVQYVKGI